MLRVNNPSFDTFSDIIVNVGSEKLALQKLGDWRFKEFEFPYLGAGKHNISVRYRTMYGQQREKTIHLEYGESTFVSEESIKLEEQIEEKEEIKTNETNKNFELDIDPNTLLVLFGIVGGIIVLIGIVSFIKSKRSGNIGQEIKDIQEAEKKNDTVVSNVSKEGSSETNEDDNETEDEIIDNDKIIS